MQSLDIGCGKNKRGSIGVDLYGDCDVRADAHFLPFQSGCFNRCSVYMCLEHVAQPDRVVAEIQRVLSVDGVVVGSVPLHSKMSFYQFKQIVLLRLRFAYAVHKALLSGEHRWQYSVTGLAKLLKLCGFCDSHVVVKRCFPYVDGEIVFSARRCFND